jgi:tetratricopeptide (TPR) repeat protein
VAYLEQLTSSHPYFTAAQFYLLQLTPKESSKYNRQAAITSLLFNNPHWLNYTLVNGPIDTAHFQQGHSVVITDEDDTALDTADTVSESDITTEQPASIPFDRREVETTSDTIVFQPLYTSDYFASQGIKLSEQVAENDKLGKQLKSFTEWLKTMKKIHTDQENQHTQANQGDLETQQAIQQLAEKSNSEGSIVTEAMAEVLVQQGRPKKAIEVYEKLSLLNPSRIAYFAAKIEQLKEP